MKNWVAIGLVAAVLGACSGGGDAALACEEVSQAMVDAIQTGVKVEGGTATLRFAQAVKSNEFNKAWMISADIEGPGLEDSDDVGTWMSNDLEPGRGLIFSVDSVAKAFSDWGPADTTDAAATSQTHGVAESKACVKRAAS